MACCREVDSSGDSFAVAAAATTKGRSGSAYTFAAPAYTTAAAFYTTAAAAAYFSAAAAAYSSAADAFLSAHLCCRLQASD